MACVKRLRAKVAAEQEKRQLAREAAEREALKPRSLAYTLTRELGIGLAMETLLPRLESKRACSFAIISGALPQGLKLDQNTGAISGVPTKKSQDVVEIRAGNIYGSCSTHLTLKIHDALAPAGLKVSDITLIFGVSAAAFQPVLSTVGVPYTNYRITCTSSNNLQCELRKHESFMAKASLHKVAAACLQACKSILSSLQDTNKVAASMKRCHEEGLALPKVSEGLKTVVVQDLESLVQQKQKQLDQALAGEEYLAADRIKRERQLLRADVDAFRSFHKHATEVQMHASKAHCLLSPVAVCIKELLEHTVPECESLADMVKSGLADSLRITNAVTGLARDEFVWMGERLQPLLAATADALASLRLISGNLKLKPMIGSFRAKLNQLSTEVWNAMQALARMSAALSSATVPHMLQQAFWELQPSEGCALVAVCCTGAYYTSCSA